MKVFSWTQKITSQVTSRPSSISKSIIGFQLFRHFSQQQQQQLENGHALESECGFAHEIDTISDNLAMNHQMVKDKRNREVFASILNSIKGRKSEVRLYLKHFAKIENTKFAVILVEDRLNQQTLPTLATSLTYLQKLGLYPIVLYGNTNWEFPQLQNPFRYSSESYLETVEFVDSIESCSGRALPLGTGIFQTTSKENSFGHVSSVSTDFIFKAIKMGHLPIISSISETKESSMFNLNPLVAVKSLSQRIKPHKVILLNQTGGITQNNKILNLINLEDQYDNLLKNLDDQFKTKLTYVKDILEDLPDTSSVAMTSPDGLLSELFTHLGSTQGTLFRKGFQIKSYFSYKDVDLTRLGKLLEDSFGKQLVSDYFDTIAQRPFRIYLVGDYNGCAILTYEGGIPYMCKFAVSPESQGKGIADMLWAHLTNDNPDMFWRSRVDNNVNNWYFDRADGNYTSGKWTVFWYGLKGFDMMQHYSDFSLSLPATFHQKIESTFS